MSRLLLSARALGLWRAIAGIAAIAIFAGCGPTNDFPELSGEYAYVANAGDGTISVFAINTTTGSLSFLQSVSVAPGFRVFALALHWSNEFLYATIDDESEIEGLDIGDGSFSGQIFDHTGPVPAVNGPRGVALNPKGTYLYATNYGGIAEVVSQYTVNQQTGALTANGTAPTGARPFGIAVDPGGNCVYVANTGDHNLSEYGIGSTGALSNFATESFAGTSDGPGPELVAVQNNPSGSGQTVYVTDDDLGVVHQLPVLERLIGVSCGVSRPVDVDAGGKAIGIALHPKGGFLYTANSSSNNVSVFAVASTGQLTLKAQESANVSDPLSLAVDLQGKFLYVANFGNSTVAQFSINQTTGALSPIGVGKVPTENPPKSATGPITIVTTLGSTGTIHRL